MLRALWFAVRTALLVAAAVWIADRPGRVTVDWLGYTVQTKVGYALLALLVLSGVIFTLFSMMAMLWRAPRAWRRRRARLRHRQGYRALTLGLTAVAAGDAKLATYQAQRTRHLWPEDRALGTLLEAQAARLQSDDAAAATHFETLLAHRDTGFLGLRGLLLAALERDDAAEAARLAARALKLYPGQPWVLRTAYELDVRLGRWDAAQRRLKHAAAHGALPEATSRGDRAALLLQEAEELRTAGDEKGVLGRLKAAHRLHPAFVPATLALASACLARDNPKGAADAVETTWRENPHPDLATLWREAMPAKLARDGAGRMSWFEKLVALRPDSVESQLAAAEAAIENNLWGAARAYLERAEAIASGRRVFRLRARLAQALDRPEEANLMLRRSTEAPVEKGWIDRISGRSQERWTPVTPEHGGFNTIIWDYPSSSSPIVATTDRSELLITAPPLSGRQGENRPFAA